MKSNSIFALLAGVAAGLTVGILLAPEKGEETRRKIKKTAEDCVDKVKEKISDIKASREADDVVDEEPNLA
jgi:gas vesicle protein